jgi:cytochrome c peroxidase
MLSALYGFLLKSTKISNTTDSYFSRNLGLFKNELIKFKTASQQKTSRADLQQIFKQTRLSFKTLAVLSDYFNPYEIKSLNGPAIDRIEEDNPDAIIPPHGLQAIETLLFGEWTTTANDKIATELELMLRSVDRMQNETGRSFKFSDELVWDAVRSSIISVASLGITGFDSPLANYSIPEARSTFKGIKEVVQLFEERINKKDASALPVIFQLIDRADAYLNSYTNFANFDRLVFISQYINPLYAAIVKTRIAAGIAIPPGARPFNYNAESFFSPEALNLDFYSPEKEYLLTKERIALGKKLFFDPVLSGTGTRSCASCHQPEKAFTDGLKIPFAMDNKTPLQRNTPTLWNSVFQTSQFFDSRTSSLETQLSEVVHSTGEMNGSLANNARELSKSDIYKGLFQKAYVNEKEPLVPFTIANAIASYVRSLVALNSRFDQYMMGNEKILTATEKQGFNLFTGKARCATCHFIPLFNGLVPPEFVETESEVLGVPQKASKKNAVLDPDPGKFDFTQSVIHKHAFKTPTLRNIAQTAPYMHNGVYKTLEEVMDFYNNGGGAGLKIAPANQTLAPDKLNLSKKEVRAIISFLNTLTDTTAHQYR